MIGLARKGLRKVRRRFRNAESISAPGTVSRFWIVLLTAFAVLFSSFLFPMRHLFAPPSTPQVGEIAAEDIIAPFDFPIYKSETELEFERREVLSSLPAVLHYNHGVVDSVFSLLNHFFHLTDSLRERVKMPNRVAERLRLFYPEIRENVLRRVAAADSLPLVKEVVESSLRDRFVVGVAPSDTLVPPGYQTVLVKKTERNYSFAADQVLGLQRARQQLREDAEIHAHNSTEIQEAAYGLSLFFLKPNLSYSEDETRMRRDEALAAIPLERMWFRAGQRLVARNEPVTITHLEWIKALAEHRSATGIEAGALQYLLPIFARVIFVSFVFLSLLLAFYYIHGKQELRLIRIFPLLLIILLTVVTGYLMTEQAELSQYLVPIGAGIILIVVLYDLSTAIIVTIAEALLFGILYEFSFEHTFLVAVTGLTVAFSMRQVTRRSDFYSGALYLAVALVITAYLLETLRFSDSDTVLKQCGYGIANAALSSFVAMALLPLFESFFSVTTNITLLELSDMNHPLLKRLALESPGTYHHSLVIGSLCETAAEAINANSLLARIGAYYHDVGKMEISEYFVENQAGIKSKHEELSPSMSALVIKSHITRGRELAEEYDLPDRIIAFIEEHHGTSLMTYFHVKAKELHPDEEVPETEYRYPGPKPQSKETAILMLADSVEAASRTLDDPKPSRIRGLVKRIINDKVQSGQLAESSLTLRDLQGIEDAFVKVLIGAFHSRIEYPRQEEEKTV